MGGGGQHPKSKVRVRVKVREGQHPKSKVDVVDRTGVTLKCMEVGPPTEDDRVACVVVYIP